MGYFAYLYVVEAKDNQDSIALETNIYSDHVGESVYFSWESGERATPLNPFAQGTIFCASPLKLLPGYPVKSSWSDPDRLELEASFMPQQKDDPIIFHFLLPERFVARGDLAPLNQPSEPTVTIHGEKLAITYTAVGHSEVRFQATRLRQTESLSDFDRILKPPEITIAKKAIEFGIPGFFKIVLSS